MEQNPKEIGRRAGRVLAYNLPSDWILRSQEDQEDYGIDAEIEISSPADKATGFIFKAQIKGQSSVEVVNNGTQISFSLPIDRLKYYMQQIEMPLVLFVVDVGTEMIYWVPMQDNEAIAESLHTAIENEQKYLAVRLRTEDTLPARSEELLTAVRRTMDWLRLHALDRLSGSVESLVSQSSDDVVEKLLYNNKKLSYRIYNEKFDRLFRQKDFDKLFETTDKVMSSQSELVITRITAALYIEKIILNSFDRLGYEQVNTRVSLYASMLKIVRGEKTPIHIRHLVVALIRILRLEVSVNSDYHYFISSKHVGKDSLTGWILNVSRLNVSRKAGQEVTKMVMFANREILSGRLNVFIEILPKLSAFITLYTHRLYEDGLVAQAEYLASWLKYCIDLAIAVARETKDINCFIDAITANASSALDDGGKLFRIEESLNWAVEIEDKEIRKIVEYNLNSLKEEITTNQIKTPTPDEEVRFFRERALGLGIDINNPDDDIGKIIHQGLVDYNPERVIKDCEFLIMVPTRNLGVPAQMVGLPSAGMKFLYCAKKGHALGGWSLDSIYKSPIPPYGFNEQFCERCEFNLPRDPVWKWSSQWQQEQAVKFESIFNKLSSF